ncbi:MAG: DUF2500 domain-containing protein [Tumebacillaceae bacterium]
MSTLIPIFFVIVFALLIFRVVRGIGEWSRNNQQPVLTVDALVVGKRHHTSNRVHNSDQMHHHHSNTTYFVTFQVESGDRLELQVSGREYGMVAERDRGRLTFQGTRYHEFERVGSV